jgi:NAD(P)-dependent dehydrogenase (short-subunit alcohol dehydrogenase family)
VEDLRDKVAVITGGASGIGKAVATLAAAEGMKVVLADIEEPVLKEAEAELSGQGADVISVVTDVADANSVHELRDQALRRYGAVHLIHNNAGVGVGGPLWTVCEEEWRWILGVNLWGVIHGIATFVPLFIDQGEGHVVNTASVAGLTSSGMIGPYNATKHAVVTISETLYRDLEMVGAPVGVSVLCPGFVQTGIADSDRNRPEWAPTSTLEGAPETADFIRQLVAAGIPPATVAERVLDAVRRDSFYILTHPELNEAMETRVHDILLGRSPSPTMMA